VVHEAFLRIQPWVEREGIRNPDHFKYLLARAMRNLLVDCVRRRRIVKITLDDSVPLPHDQSLEILELERFLGKLAQVDAEAVEIVVARFYGGLTEEEIARHLGKSRSWVQKRWRWVRAWWVREQQTSSR
jgi:RNA polymerase sigma factor (sigma-70 family)